MGYIGKEVTAGQTETVKDSFNGDNSTTAFTLSRSVSLDTDIEVFVDNIQQEPGSTKAYSVSGTTLTFTEAPPTGTGNVYVVHRNSLQGTLLPPQNLGDRNYLIGGNLSLDKDSAVLNFGADSDINITHVADTGLTTNGVLRVDDTTEATSTTDGSLQTDGGLSVVKDIVAGDDVKLLSDDAVLSFGANSEITVTHHHDNGLKFKNTNTADGSQMGIVLQTGETDIQQDDVLGRIQFQAPDEASASGDNILIAAEIAAISEGDFSSSSNATSLVFKTGASEAATEKMRIRGNGNIGIGIATPTFATGNGVHLADDFQIGFGNGNGTRPDFQIGYDATNTRLRVMAGTGSDDSDLIITTGGLLGVGIVPTGSHRQLNSSFGDDKQAFAGVGKDGTYATEVMNVFAERTANSAFSLYKAHSNDNADAEFNFRGDGNAFADGTFSGGGADYAEFFEWKDGNSSDEDRVGFTVVLDENKIVKATDSDDTSKIIGVMSARPVVLGDGDIERWKYKYLRDDYGREIWEEHTITEWTENGEKVWYETDKIPEDVTVPSNKKVITTESDGVTKLKRRKLNPSWDKSKTYVSREDRKEWGMVGLMGKLRLRKGQPTGDRWIKMRDVSDTVEEWLVR